MIPKKRLFLERVYKDFVVCDSPGCPSTALWTSRPRHRRETEAEAVQRAAQDSQQWTWGLGFHLNCIPTNALRNSYGVFCQIPGLTSRLTQTMRIWARLWFPKDYDPFCLFLNARSNTRLDPNISHMHIHFMRCLDHVTLLLCCSCAPLYVLEAIRAMLQIFPFRSMDSLFC